MAYKGFGQPRLTLAGISSPSCGWCHPIWTGNPNVCSFPRCLIRPMRSIILFLAGWKATTLPQHQKGGSGVLEDFRTHKKRPKKTLRLRPGNPSIGTVESIKNSWAHFGIAVFSCEFYVSHRMTSTWSRNIISIMSGHKSKVAYIIHNPFFSWKCIGSIEPKSLRILMVGFKS